MAHLKETNENYRAEDFVKAAGQDDVAALKERLTQMEENLTAAHQNLNLAESTNSKLQHQLQEAESNKAILQEQLDNRIAETNITESFRKDDRTGNFYTGMLY